ncbi:glycoside hydrolase family 43 protein [Geofilum rubicundum]|uniref:Beta-xylosidase n=1 Tax=Geofilum rubicundum JCM 15548 TaxID=1236989 RepID=A0A0E9M172_9BACT|nr:glycoside hydrolase family 43 protein [Geofilum rubicundum]GAO30870.1 beta-xylosidase [Geofilum rubicundum JCM 15548]
MEGLTEGRTGNINVRCEIVFTDFLGALVRINSVSFPPFIFSAMKFILFKKLHFFILAVGLAVLFSQCQQATNTPYEPTTIVNPILPGFYPDPSVCAGEDGYYMVHSTFGYFPGIPIFYSPDLVHWEQIGHVLNRPEQVQFEGLGLGNEAIFAPTIEYHNGTYYVACTEVWGRGNFVVSAQDPSDPWSNPTFFPEVSGIDPSLVFDEDKVYMVYNSDAPDNTPLYEGHRTIRLYELDMDEKVVVGEPTILVNGGVDISEEPVWIEGPHIYHIDGMYYLSAAEGGTSVNHRQVIFRSEDIRGPYVPWEKNPILTQMHLDPNRPNPITSTGHADLIQDLEGNWWSVFLACRPYEGNHYNTGRETFMAPVRWEDGWPVINPDFEEVQYTYAFNSALKNLEEIRPLNGNFTLRDDFTRDELDMTWVHIRVPDRPWYQIDAPGGVLSMELLPGEKMLESSPSFIGRRQQHLVSSATTAIEFTPQTEDHKAGIAILQKENRFYYLCQSLENGQPVVQLFRSNAESSLYELELMLLPYWKETARRHCN